MRYASLTSQDSFNVGDDGKSIAVERLLPHVDLRLDRMRFAASKKRSREVRGSQRVLEGVASVARYVTRSESPVVAGRIVAQYWFRGEANIGDRLSPEIARRVLRIRPRWVRREFRGKLLSTGSIARSVAKRDVLLGAGLIEPGSRSLPEGARVLLLRGPLSREQFGGGQIPERYGDPALLTAQLFPAISRVPDSAPRIGVVPHYTDTDVIRLVRQFGGMRLLDVSEEPTTFIRGLAGCSVVVSSSLHGIIIAESFGIPAIWLRPAPGMKGGAFKFRDYYMGTGRRPHEPLALVSALELAESGGPPAWTPNLADIRAAFAEAASLLGSPIDLQPTE